MYPKALTPGPYKFYFTVLGCFLALYALTCAPGYLWQDSGEFHYRVWLSDINYDDYDGELVRSHPLYILISLATKLIPGGDFAGKVNMVSAIFGAITVANLCYLVRLWTCSNKAALASALSLGLAWTFWQHSTIAEVYTLYTAILSAELIMLFLYLERSNRAYLYLLFFLNGLSISNHIFGVFPLLCYSLLVLLLFIKKEINLQTIALCGVTWAAGDALYLFFIIKLTLKSGSLYFALKSATTGHFKSQIANLVVSGRAALENVGFILYNFCSPAIVLLGIGLTFWRKAGGPKYFVGVCLCILTIFFIFAFRYNVPDRYAFFMPFYLLAALFIGLGAHILFSHKPFTGLKTQAFIFFLIGGCPIFFYWQTPIQLQRIHFSLGTKRQIPFRNEYEYFLRPWQHTTTQAEKFARESLETTSQNSVVIVDAMAYYPLWMAQVEKKVRADVKIIMAFGPDARMSEIKSFADEGGLYVVSPIKDYCPQYILDDYEFVRAGPIYRVKKKDTLKSTPDNK